MEAIGKRTHYELEEGYLKKIQIEFLKTKSTVFEII